MGEEEEIFKVYVRGTTIGDTIREADLKTAFSKYGEIVEVWIASQGRAFAFIRFKNKDDAEAAIKGMHDQEMGGCRLQVEMARKAPRDRGDRDNRGDRRGGDRNGGGGGREVKLGDWSCPSCNVNNFARRDKCFRCQADKPIGASNGYDRDDRRRGRGRSRDRGDGDRRGGYDRDERRGGYDREDRRRRDDDRGRGRSKSRA